jgi:cation transport ATPase
MEAANTNTLVVTGTSTAYLYSLVATLAPQLFASQRAEAIMPRPFRAVVRRPMECALATRIETL